LNLKGSNSNGAVLGMQNGSDPTGSALVDRRMWYATGQFKFRVNGQTVKLYQETGVSAMTNVTAPVNLDADTVTTAELADIVGNLINKLRNHNLIGD
jgi:hypothetical protein